MYAYVFAVGQASNNAKQIAQGAQRCGVENFFVVAAIAQGMNKLICYGGNLRIAVSPSDLVMV